MTDQTNGKLTKCIALARERKDLSLIQCLQRLKKEEQRIPGMNIFISSDFAPFSLYFEKWRNEKMYGNGGIIFHGKHDGFGSGAAPTFSVSMTPSDGWEIHT